MKRFDKILTDTLDPLSTFVCHIDQDGLVLLVPPALSTAGAKRWRTADGEQPSESKLQCRESSNVQTAAFDELVTTRRSQLKALCVAIQSILKTHGGTRKRVSARCSALERVSAY